METKTQFLRHVQQIIAKAIETVDAEIGLSHVALSAETLNIQRIYNLSNFFKKKRLFCVLQNCNRVAKLTNYICNEDLIYYSFAFGVIF